MIIQVTHPETKEVIDIEVDSMLMENHSGYWRWQKGGQATVVN